MPHFSINYSLIFRLSVIWAVSLLMGISGCYFEDYHDYRKKVEINGDNFTCRNCNEFGRLVEIQGNSMAIAEAQILFLFERNAGKWNLVQEIKYDSSNAFIEDIVLLPSLLAVGVVEFSGDGKVELYERISNGSWSKFQKLMPDQRQNQFGQSIDVSNDRMIVGAPGNPFNPIGRAYIYKLENTNWVLEAKLKANSTPDDSFGIAVCLLGSYALISNPKCDSAQVFKRDNDNWSFHQFLRTNGGAAIANFENEVIVAGRSLTVLALDISTQEFVGRTIETVREYIPRDIFKYEWRNVEMYDGYALASMSYGYSGKCFLFQLNGNNWSFDQEFNNDAISLAISDQFIALGLRDDEVELYPR